MNVDKIKRKWSKCLTIKNVVILLLVVFPIARKTKNELFILLFLGLILALIMIMGFTLPQYVSSKFRESKQRNFYTWSRLRLHASVSDFTTHFFSPNNTFNQDKELKNFDRDKQIVEHLKSFDDEELEVGLALLSKSSIKNPVVSILTTSAIISFIIQQRSLIFDSIERFFSIDSLPSFASFALLIEIMLVIFVFTLIFIIEWNHRSYLIKMVKIALKYKE